MKRTIYTLFAAAALAMALPSVSSADAKSDRAGIEAAYTKLVKALKAKDMKGIMAVGTSDFTMKEKKGPPMKAADVTKMMEAQFAMVKSVDNVSYKANRVKVSGNTAVVNSTMKMAMTMPDPQTKKDHKIASVSEGKDTLVKTPKGWLFKSVETISDKTTMDGKPFDPSMMAPPPSTSKKHGSK